MSRSKMFEKLKKRILSAVQKIAKKGEEKEKIEVKKKKVEEKVKKKKGFLKKIIKKIKVKKLKKEDIEPIISEFKINLIEADASLEVANKIGDDLIKSLVEKEIERKKFKEKIIESLKESLIEILNIPSIDLEKIISKAKNEDRAATFIFFGINGVGKSLSIAKFANFLSKKGYRVILAAGDTFRAAGDIQLEKYANALNLPVIKHKRGADPAAVIFDARKAAESRKYDIVLADTSGRIHTKRDLLDELQKIVRVNKPDLKILVLDSLSGNDVISQFEFFDEAVGIDAVVFTKVDVNEKGGNILSVCYKFKKPILFLGKGQNFDDMEEFDSQRFINNLIGDLKI